jgi:hypothetical protein
MVTYLEINPLVFFSRQPMSTNCAPLLADLFLYSYEADFIQGLLKKNEKKLARSFNFTFRYKVDVLSLEINPLNRPSLSISRCRSRYEADLSVSVVSFISSSMG